MNTLLRIAAGCSVMALAILSWLPNENLVRTGILSGHQEHFLAYMVSGLLVATAVPRYRFVHVAIFYALLAVLLELGQNFAPGRQPEAVAVIMSLSGAVVGEIIARLVSGAWRKKYGFPPSLMLGRAPRASRAASKTAPQI